jgi:hypothetical protein
MSNKTQAEKGACWSMETISLSEFRNGIHRFGILGVERIQGDGKNYCFHERNLLLLGRLIKSSPTVQSMNPSISHDRSEETPEAKARWFQSLSLDERMEMFCEITDFILAVNPAIVDMKDAQPVKGRIRVLSKA